MAEMHVVLALFFFVYTFVSLDCRSVMLKEDKSKITTI